MNTTDAPEARSPEPARNEPPSYLPVLISGLLTTSLTLLGVYVLDLKVSDFHIMGWYGDYVIPVGAIIVGVVAASGYGAASWLSGIKITRALLWVVLFFQVGAYFGAEYIEFESRHLVYRQTGKPVGFLEYYDLNARSFAWKQENGTIGKPLGIWGYAFRFLDVIGFAGGGLIVPALLWKAPYCQSCRRYMRHRSLALVPGSVALKKIKKADTEGQAAYEQEQVKSRETALELLETLRRTAAEGRVAELKMTLESLKSRAKETGKLPLRYSLGVVSCSRCTSGWLRVRQMIGHGKKIKVTELPKTDLPPDVVKALCAKL